MHLILWWIWTTYIKHTWKISDQNLLKISVHEPIKLFLCVYVYVCMHIYIYIYIYIHTIKNNANKKSLLKKVLYDVIAEQV